MFFLYGLWFLLHSFFEWCVEYVVFILNEPQHDKTNKMTCAPSKDSDHPGHRPSLIRVFAVRMKKPWVLNNTLNASRVSDQSAPGAHVNLFVCHAVAHLSVPSEPRHEKTVFFLCEQQKRRSACASAQSDQRLYCSLLR